MFSCCLFMLFFFFFKQKTAYEMRISDWSSDVCSSDLGDTLRIGTQRVRLHGIDAPELAQRCGTERRQRCGEMAAAWLKARVEGKRVACTRMDDDAYGRIVAVCRIRGEEIGRASWRERVCRYV